MNDTNDLAHQTDYGLSIPTTWSSSEVLFRLVNELKSPLSSIGGYAKLLSETEIDPSKSTIAIERNVEYIRTVFDAVRVYLMESGYLPKEQEVMTFLREKVFSPVISSTQATDRLKQEIVSTVQSFNEMNFQRIISSWLYEISNKKDPGLIQQMEFEGFMHHQETLSEFQERFCKG